MSLMPPRDPLQLVTEPRRREILRLVWDEERSAGDIAGQFDVSFGAVSQHLGVLLDAGLVEMRREGRHRYYRADRDALGGVAAMLQAMWAIDLDRLAEQVEGAGDD